MADRLIFDYATFNESINNNVSNKDFTFETEIPYVDIDMHNYPDNYDDIIDKKIFIKYSTNFIFKKGGIDDIIFTVNEIEVEFTFEKYTGNKSETESIDFDIIPGKTVAANQIIINKLDNIIPTYPNRISIDMNKSMDLNKFKIEVSFGNDI